MSCSRCVCRLSCRCRRTATSDNSEQCALISHFMKMIQHSHLTLTFFRVRVRFIARSARRETDERRDSTQRRRVRTCSLTVGVGCRLRLVSLCHRVSCRVSILLNPISVCCAPASCLRPPQYVAVCDRPRSSSSSSSRRACFGVARAHARSLARSLAPLSKRRRPRAPRCWWARRPSTRGQRQGRRRRERATRGSEWGRWRGSG